MIKNLLKTETLAFDSARFGREKLGFHEDDPQVFDFWTESDVFSKSADMRLPAKHLEILKEQGMSFDIMIDDLKEYVLGPSLRLFEHSFLRSFVAFDLDVLTFFCLV